MDLNSEEPSLSHLIIDNAASSSLQLDYDKDLEDETKELEALGINVVDQIHLEQNVEAAVDKAVAKHSRKQKLRILQKEVKDLKLELMKLNKKEDKFQQRLSGMRQRFTDPRLYLAVENSQKENKVQLQTLQKRRRYIDQKLLETADNETVLDEIDLNLEDGELIEDSDEAESNKIKANNEEERQKMIKEGQMTPFGTSLHSFDTHDTQGSILKSILARPLPSTSQRVSSQKGGARSHIKTKTTFHEPLPIIKASHSSEGVNNSLKGASGRSEFEKYLQDQIDKQRSISRDPCPPQRKGSGGDPSYGNFTKRKHKAKEFVGSLVSTEEREKPSRSQKKKSPLKRSILHPKRHWKERNLGSTTSELAADQFKSPARVLSEHVAMVTSDPEDYSESGSEYVPSDEEEAEEEKYHGVKNQDITEKKPAKRKKSESEKKGSTSGKTRRAKDDGHIHSYLKRMKHWKKERLKEKHRKIIEGEVDSDEDEEYESFEGGYKIPLSIWTKLYKYQKTCVKWLWELHIQNCGGILGDEMGLGKTIMVISFLAGLSYSGLICRGQRYKGLGPVLIVCPATVMHQWVMEFQKWWPLFRVAVLHDSGSFKGTRSTLIHNINSHDGILVTSYRGVTHQLKVLLDYDWHYVILDEGHKIRNPEAQITVAVKRFQTPHRIILSGSPIQNSLKELWSLFDFVFPGKLGTLQVFLQQFAVPITLGGYANASKLEVQTAFRCATVLRDTINPFLLRRMKADVRSHLALPDKNEQVLFCGLTDEQRSLYRDYLDGNQVKSIMSGRIQVFVGLINLRKICNHPHLYDGGPRHYVGEDISDLPPEEHYGWWKVSGKMVVLHSILRLWKKQSHRVLLFTQSRQMKCILEKYLVDEGYSFIKMDGCTSVGSRQPLIAKFNTDPSIFVFLLTTRVGGVGVNLTGADRVVIFDPDWNPSTDTQAKERAWRIGQTRHVTIYRLITAGTIEEKIYHRQIFKQFLTNRVLKDPKQQRFFKTNDLHELFTLNEGLKEKTESAVIFSGIGSEIEVKTKEKRKVGEDNKSKQGENNESKLDKDKGKLRKDRSMQKTKVDNSFREERNTIKDDQKGDLQGKSKSVLKNPIGYVTSGNLDVVEGQNIVRQSLNGLKIVDESLSSVEVLNEPSDAKFETDTTKDTTIHQVAENTADTTPKETEESSANTDISKKNDFELEEEKRERIKKLAKMLSQKITQNKKESSDNKVKGLRAKDNSKAPKTKGHAKKGKKFEGERVENLVKMRKFKGADDEKGEEEDTAKLNKTQDDFVLQKLFQKSGVHTALSHDVILNASDPDYLLMESEADKVAKEALKQVRLSRTRCFQTQRGSKSGQVPLNQSKKKDQPKFGGMKSRLVTETENEKRKKGKNRVRREGRKEPKMFNGGIEEEDESDSEEVAPLTPVIPSSVPPTDQPREGASSGVLSSAQLLKRMKDRNRDLLKEKETRPTPDPYGEITYDPDYPSTADLVNQSEEPCDPELLGDVELLTDIRNFVAFQAATDGRASTEEVVQRFQPRLPPNRNHIFKALLNQICDFVRDSSRKGFWYIKEEFR